MNDKSLTSSTSDNSEPPVIVSSNLESADANISKTMTETSSAQGGNSSNGTKSELDALFDRFVLKVNEDRKLVIAEIKSALVAEIKDEIMKSVNESIQKSIASIKTEVYKDLENKFSGELSDMHNDIVELNSLKDNNIDTINQVADISSRLKCLENPAQSKITAHCLNEFEERMVRKKNVMIYNVPEIKNTDSNSRVTGDLESISTIIREIAVDIDISSSNCSRVGKFSPNLARPRPFKLRCFSDNKAHEVMVKGSQMKARPEASPLLKMCLFLPDLTIQQRTERKQLKAELDQRRIAEKNPDLKIWTQNGIPRIRNMKKTAKITQPRPPVNGATISPGSLSQQDQ